MVVFVLPTRYVYVEILHFLAEKLQELELDKLALGIEFGCENGFVHVDNERLHTIFINYVHVIGVLEKQGG